MVLTRWTLHSSCTGRRWGQLSKCKSRGYERVQSLKIVNKITCSQPAPPTSKLRGVSIYSGVATPSHNTRVIGGMFSYVTYGSRYV